MDINDIFEKSFLEKYHLRKKQQKNLNKDDLLIIERKTKQLQPIMDFLDLFIENGIYVKNRELYSTNSKPFIKNKKVPFKYYKEISSPSFHPGLSIFIEHPASIEIAIPNNTDKYGAVMINVASHNVHSYLIEHRFSTMESACKALGEFILQCAVDPD